jgi:two-component system CheB/CheR fusion protein
MTAKKRRKEQKSQKVDPSRASEMPGTPERALQPFPIVGIGASAGGLAAFESFLSTMPSDAISGMAFVLVQHLAPDHKSILSDLIKRYTKMQVFEVEDGMKVQPNCAYIIPPNRDMAFLNGSLQLLEPSAPRGQRLPIDFFFRSLAQDQHDRAICIVLSGTGSDGTEGVRAVKGEGGMAMAQNPESTEYDGMPRSAIATGLVDYVLPPAEMPAQLIAYVEHAFKLRPRLASSAAPKREDMLKKVLILLRAHTGHDFSQYKQNTVIRRIERRMAVHEIAEPEGYLRYAQGNTAELDALFRDLLIGVTRFFRDPREFAALQEQVIKHIFPVKPAEAAIRIWVPGCSTGEEAYSIAILLQERLTALKQHFKVQVFATDIDGRAIAQARAGVYPSSIVADISPQRLARFFSREADSGAYRIHKDIRDMMVFSEQDVAKDPPFSKLDLISCRNLLIYMGPELQKKVVALFHYALNPGGRLFLGTSETVGEYTDLFAALDRKSKLYESKEITHRASRPAMVVLPRTVPRVPVKTPSASKLSLRESVEGVLLRQHDAVAVLIDRRGSILYVHGRSGQYLEPAPGPSDMNILKMAREGLRRELATALHRAATQKEPVRRAGLRVKTNGDFTAVDLKVQSMPAGGAGEPSMFLVILEAADAAGSDARRSSSSRKSPQVIKETGGDARIAALKEELRAKEEYLRATTEELETSNEELQSSNEEMQSVNEEMQSTNEEMETSKEELQSVNEELSTVNAELQAKVADLSRANNDMNNLMAGSGVGTIFVDHQLMIQRFTPAVIQVINLIPTDVGRPVGDIAANLVGYDHLADDTRAVLSTLVPKDVEVQAKTGARFLLRIRPYRTLENVIEGAVITFVDVTEMKRAQEALQEVNVLRRLAAVVRDSHDAITVHDLEGRILAWNPGAQRMYGWTEAEALSMNIRDMTPKGLHQEAIAAAARLSRAEVLEAYRTQRLAKGGRIVQVWMTATALIDAAGKAYAIATTERALR